jgi:hypothetical protein
MLINSQKQEEIKESISNLIVTPFNEAKEVLEKEYRQDKQKTIKKLLIVGSIILLSIIISIFVFRSGWNKVSPRNARQHYSYMRTTVPKGQAEVSQSEEPSSSEKVTVSQFLTAYKTAIDIFSPIFDSFIAYTADVTGKSKPQGSSFQYSPTANYDTEFITGTTIPSIRGYYQISLSIAIPILVVIVTFRGVVLSSNVKAKEAQEYSTFLWKLLLTIALLILGPQIMSIGIVSANLLSKEFAGGVSMTEFLLNFVESLETQYESNAMDYISNGLSTVLSGGISGMLGFINSIPIILPLSLVLLLFLYVSFQFIIRFATLYFIAAVYPLAIIFLFANSKIPKNYLNKWISLLLHQPAFVLAYTILQSIIQAMLDQRNNSGIELIIVFVGFLFFVASINVVVSSIWGGIYSSIQQTATSAFATDAVRNVVNNTGTTIKRALQNFSTGEGVTTPTNRKTRVGQRIQGNGGIFSDVSSGFSSPVGKNISSSQRINKDDSSGLKVNHARLNDGAKSFLAQDLKKQGIDILDADTETGTMTVGGNFYKHTDEESGLTTLYTSQENAVLDGKPKDQIKPIAVEGINIRDTSNKVGTQRYNRTIGKFKKEKGFPGKVHLTQSASDGWVKNNMKLGKSFNQTRNVAGVAVKRYAKNAKKDDPSGRISKIVVYNELLNEEGE